MPIIVCFSPKAIKLLHSREMTRWAKMRLMQCNKRLLKDGHANPVVDFDQCTKPLPQKSRLRALAV
jgi:hypothetical protein